MGQRQENKERTSLTLGANKQNICFQNIFSHFLSHFFREYMQRQIFLPSFYICLMLIRGFRFAKTHESEKGTLIPKKKLDLALGTKKTWIILVLLNAHRAKQTLYIDGGSC